MPQKGSQLLYQYPETIFTPTPKPSKPAQALHLVDEPHGIILPEVSGNEAKKIERWPWKSQKSPIVSTLSIGDPNEGGPVLKVSP